MGYKDGLAYDAAAKRWRVRRMIAGRIVKRSFRTRQTAVDFIGLLERQAAGLHLPTPSLTVGDAWTAYKEHLTSHLRSADTIAYYAKIMARVFEYWHADTSADLDKAAVMAYVAFRRQHGSGEATLLKELKALRSMIRAAGLTPGWGLPALSPGHTHRRVPPDHEIASVYLALKRPDAERAFLLCLLVGLRPSEALAAEYSWVDRDAHTIRVHSRKTKVHFTTWAAPTLLAALPPDASGRIVDLSETALRSLLHRRTAALRLDPVWTGLEGLRHACGTWTHEAGATPEEVDLLLGHVKPGSVAQKHYLHAANVTLRKRWLEVVERRFLAALSAWDKRVQSGYNLVTLKAV